LKSCGRRIRRVWKAASKGLVLRIGYRKNYLEYHNRDGLLCEKRIQNMQQTAVISRAVPYTNTLSLRYLPKISPSNLPPPPRRSSLSWCRRFRSRSCCRSQSTLCGTLLGLFPLICHSLLSVTFSLLCNFLLFLPLRCNHHLFLLSQLRVCFVSFLLLRLSSLVFLFLLSLCGLTSLFLLCLCDLVPLPLLSFENSVLFFLLGLCSPI
jgi:hypothetical protein